MNAPWWDRVNGRLTTTRLACALACASAMACSSAAGVSGTTTDGRGGSSDRIDVGARPLDVGDADGSRPDRPERDTGVPDQDTDAPDTAAPPDAAPDLGLAVDASIDDAFVRPIPDATPDAPTDIDAAPDIGAPDTGTPDADGDAGGSGRVSGDYECFHYDIYLGARSFDFKVDDIAMTYTVRNTCARPLTFRVRRENDFFPIVIEKDGEPWIYLPDCPAPEDTSPSESREFEFRAGEGWSRGRFWNAAEHELQLESCGVTFDSASSYAVRGYGMLEVNLLEPGTYSEAVPITVAIPIELRP